MRAEHWYDFFVQVIAHIAAAAVPNPMLQYLEAGQITPIPKPTGGHRPLLMMSFLRRLALKSVRAAKNESVAKCAGPLQYGVGRPDGANTMIKTIQYLAEAEPSKMCLAEQCCTVSRKPMRILQLSSLSGTPATRSTDCTTILPTPRLVPTVGWIRAVLCQRVAFQLPLTPLLRSVLAQLCTHYDSGAKLLAYLDDWYLWIKPQYLLQTIAVITTATRSVNLAPQSTKTQVWKGSCQDTIPPEFQEKVKLTLSCLGGHEEGSQNPVWEELVVTQCQLKTCGLALLLYCPL